MKKPVKILFTLLIIIFVGVFIYSGYQVYKTVFADGGYYKSNKATQEYQQAYVKPVEQTAAPVIEETVTNEIQLDDEVCPIEIDFAALSQRNSDIVGWLYCPDTVINYPVTQYDDNMYYLHKDIDGNYSSYGTLFVECLCQKDTGSTNTIIYGHHMNDGKMFAKLVDYSYQNYYDEHPVFYYLTPTRNYRVELFTGYVTSMTSDTYSISFDNIDANRAWLDSVKSQSRFQANVDVQPGDKILTLSTCTYDYDDARFVVLGKLVPIH